MTLHPWDSGTGKRMLFLQRRYYIFDDEERLLDGGVIRYNETLDKIFIRNEDLRGELFITLENDGRVRLKGSVSSKLAGTIYINTLLQRYNKVLMAPVSRVAQVEKYLSGTDLYTNLYKQENIEEFFLKNFEKNLHSFSPEQAQRLYVRLAQYYFQNFDPRILESICLYFSTYSQHDKLYEELFMFAMAVQTAREHGYLKKVDMDFFVRQVKTRLLDSYIWHPSTISLNMINECLLYFGLESPHLPNPQECIKKLYDKELSVQKEYAFYLSLMQEKAKEVEDEIYERLLSFYQESFLKFKQKLKEESLSHTTRKKTVSELNTLLALIKALGNCKSENREVHIFFLFLLSNSEERIKESARKALSHCWDKASSTLKKLYLCEDDLKVQLTEIMQEQRGSDEE